jgi:hypothetical protein
MGSSGARDLLGLRSGRTTNAIYRVQVSHDISRLPPWQPLDARLPADLWEHWAIQSVTCQETPMSKRGRKRRSRKGSAANHGKRPNA